MLLFWRRVEAYKQQFLLLYWSLWAVLELQSCQHNKIQIIKRFFLKIWTFNCFYMLLIYVKNPHSCWWLSIAFVDFEFLKKSQLCVWLGQTFRKAPSLMQSWTGPELPLLSFSLTSIWQRVGQATGSNGSDFASSSISFSLLTSG